MDIAKQLASGHSKVINTRITRYIGADRKRFSVLMKIFLHGGDTMRQRAAWALGDLGAEHPALIAPYTAKLIAKLEEPGLHPAIHRNILRIFLDMQIPEKYCGRLLDLSFAFMRDEKAPVAARALSITIASKICKRFPGLEHELRLLLDELGQQPQPPAIRHRMKLALKALPAAGSLH